MNQHLGVIGRKLGMTQVFNKDGTLTTCTVIEAKSVVVGKRTEEKDGYTALVLGLGDQLERRTTKPLNGMYKKAGVSPKRKLREFRCSAEVADKFEIGAELPLGDVFSPGQLVDVRGVSRGRGFTGVMVRYNFAGSTRTHGSHEVKRHGGSIGMNMTPGRVFKGKKMPGQHGNKTVSVLNQPVVKVIPEENLVLVRGAIPGSRNGYVEVRGAVKKDGGVKKASS